MFRILITTLYWDVLHRANSRSPLSTVTWTQIADVPLMTCPSLSSRSKWKQEQSSLYFISMTFRKTVTLRNQFRRYSGAFHCAEQASAVALPWDENMFRWLQHFCKNSTYASQRHQRANPTIAFIWSRGSSAASRVKMEQFNRRRQYEVHRWSGGSLEENVSLVSVFEVEMLYCWMFDLYRSWWRLCSSRSFHLHHQHDSVRWHTKQNFLVYFFFLRMMIWGAPPRQNTNIYPAALSLSHWNGVVQEQEMAFPIPPRQYGSSSWFRAGAAILR